MKDFKDKVAVITGAASGIGQALAYQCGKEGMKVVISDIDEKRLRRTERKLKREGTVVLSVITDVSKHGDIEDLAKKTLDAFGAVHLLFNNAGVALPKLTWEYELDDWDFVLGINLMGVIYGIRTFIPQMIKQDTECHVVNISSIEGLLYNGVGGATYGVCKHALVFLSERLTQELEENDHKIKVSVVCPGFVMTNIFMSSINRLPEEARDGFFQSEMDEETMENLQEFLEQSPGKTPEEVADIVFQGIKDEKLYILTHKQPILKDMLKERYDAILKAFD
ncbi:MAG: SDR family NAD(P)-dependent oxidoreductase [Candidatus Lokiarchaeota archaeon]|nr:SDR family NAD(P)-dependent oxidoreductase [Candidatus Lokiarchaeota archaeon]